MQRFEDFEIYTIPKEAPQSNLLLRINASAKPNGSLASLPDLYCTLPQISTADTKYDGSIMITASHLPYNRNGFKFFDKTAGFEKKEITDLLSRAAKDAASGSLEEDPGFPMDKRQSEASEVAKLEETLKLDKSLVSKVPHSSLTVNWDLLSLTMQVMSSRQVGSQLSLVSVFAVTENKGDCRHATHRQKWVRRGARVQNRLAELGLPGASPCSFCEQSGVPRKLRIDPLLPGR